MTTLGALELEVIELLKRLYDENKCANCQSQVHQEDMEISILATSFGKTKAMMRTCGPKCFLLLSLKIIEARLVDKI